MRHISKLVFCAAIIMILFGCAKKSELRSFSKLSGTTLEGGTVISETDTHGGFHGDGESLLKVQYTGNAPADSIAAAEHWHFLPLPEKLRDLVYQSFSIGDELPETEAGWYFFYDRHSDSTNPYDESKLYSRYSYNFTLAIFDTSTNVLYLCRFDT